MQTSTMKLETVTPKIAKDWLETVKKNRPLADHRVVEYGLQIEAGTWVENGETIKFNSKGELFDGQHRLQACILAGKPFRTFVARGIEDERAFATVDVGKARTPGDIFSLQGFASGQAISAGARMLYWHKHKLITPLGPKGHSAIVTQLVRGTRFSNAGRIQIPSKDELLKFAISMEKELEGASRFTHNTKTSRLLTPAVAIAAYILFSRKSEEDATCFFSDLGAGAGLMQGDPAHVLRDKIMGTRVGGSRVSGCTLLFYTIKAWNKRREGVSVKYLRMDEGEDFPALV